MKIPNTSCLFCKKEIFRKPSEIARGFNIFCSRKCYRLTTPKKKFNCKNCLKEFIPPSNDGSKRINCSVKCSNESRAGKTYHNKGEGYISNSRKKLNLLKVKFNFESCMVIGCDYNTTYDVDRLIPGKEGGKYEIGNMFAVCPNHHAEKTRGIIEFIKINDYTLDIRKKRTRKKNKKIWAEISKITKPLNKTF